MSGRPNRSSLVYADPLVTVTMIKIPIQVNGPKPQCRTMYLWKKTDMVGVNRHL